MRHCEVAGILFPFYKCANEASNYTQRIPIRAIRSKFFALSGLQYFLSKGSKAWEATFFYLNHYALVVCSGQALTRH